MTKLITPKNALMPTAPKIGDPSIQRWMDDISEVVSKLQRGIRGDADSVAAQAAGKIGTFTRDMSLASGTQAITGVGFKPSNVIFLAYWSGHYCTGFDNATGHYCIGFDTAPTYSSSYSLLLSDATNYNLGLISSLDTDGFTITWTKGNSPTGTAHIYYLALR